MRTSLAVPVVRLAQLRAAPLDVAEVLRAVDGPASGGIASFVGVVRDNDGGRSVRALSYSAHPSADRVLAKIAAEVAAGAAVHAIAVLHRVGDLAIGDSAIVAAVAAAHRGEAFDACRELVERVKHEVPIWKYQQFTDGSTEWVGAGDLA